MLNAWNIQDLGTARLVLALRQPGGKLMRTTLAGLCVLGLVMGCERKADNDTAAQVDRPSADSAMVTAATMDTSAGAKLEWGPAPAGLPAGARAAIIKGDPTKGPFTARLDFPDGYEVKPHTHPTSERLRVVEGTVMFGSGKDWDDKKLKTMGKDGTMSIGANEAHFVRAQGHAIVEVQSSGAFQINYVNSTDDPRKAPIQ
jgi:quercetin dioxygenase-like cupin family protein